MTTIRPHVWLDFPRRLAFDWDFSSAQTSRSDFPRSICTTYISPPPLYLYISTPRRRRRESTAYKIKNTCSENKLIYALPLPCTGILIHREKNGWFLDQGRPSASLTFVCQLPFRFYFFQTNAPVMIAICVDESYPPSVIRKATQLILIQYNWSRYFLY